MVLFYEAVRVAHALLQVVVGGFAQLRARLPRACKEVLYAELLLQDTGAFFARTPCVKVRTRCSRVVPRSETMRGRVSQRLLALMPVLISYIAERSPDAPGR